MKLGPVELMCDGSDRCGEAPLWDPLRRRLLWSDIPAGNVYELEGVSTNKTLLSGDIAVSGIALNHDQRLVFAGANGLFLWRGPGDYQLIVADLHGEKLIFNDILAGPAGRVYAGTLYWGETMERPGRLYLLHPTGRVQEVDDGVELANGLALSPDDRTLYFVDSAARRIYSYDVNGLTGELSRRRVLVQVPLDEGIPDGLTVDSQGFLWCAQWYGSQIVRYDPEGKVERRIRLPVQQVSSVCFGGPSLDELYITSAAELWPSQLAPKCFNPEGAMGGGLYRVRTALPGRVEHLAALH